MNKNIDFETFLGKAMKRQEEINKSFEIDVAGYGLIKFNHPKDSQLLKYLDGIGNAVETEEVEEGKNKVVSQDLVLMDEASRELVYFCCPFLQDAKLHEALKTKDFLKVPTMVFGISETMRIAGEIAERANGEKIQKDINDKIKN